MDEREVRQKLDSFLEQVKRRYRIERAILFGSRARGDYLKESDIDLILVSPDFQGIPFPDRPTPFYSFWKGSPGLELLCYTPEEFARKKEHIGLVADALQEGKELLGTKS